MTDETVAISDRGRSRRQLPEEVAAYVRELIISGRIRPGEFLRLDRIAEAVGVSNTPVREGLLTLRSEGFVELVPRRGFVAAAFSEQDAGRIAAVGHAFHREINLAADSRRLAFLLGAAVRQLPNRFYASIAGRVESARRDHPRMLEALHRGDAAAVGELMTGHILAGSDELIEDLAAGGLWARHENAS
ncbi:MAG TPA: GntR family transcriptional regulator [Actinomycetospora sp.]|uniref:GntR family transcriptional regulator n=1 Tax=Actinomycetospora sp. TaxID=1872135 RepID=UPI002F3EA125